MDCAKVREGISAWIDGEIPSTERTEMERHLAGCAPCRAERDALAAVSGTLRALPRRDAPAGIAREVRERLAREQLIGTRSAEASRRRLFLPRWMKGMGLVAAALLVVVSVGNWGGRPPPEEDAEAARSPALAPETGKIAEPADGEMLDSGDAHGPALKDVSPTPEAMESLPKKPDGDKIPDGVGTSSIDRLSDGPPGSAGGSFPSTRRLGKAKEIQEQAWDEGFGEGSGGGFSLGEKGSARSANSPERDQDDTPLGRQEAAAPIEVRFSVPDDATLERALLLARVEAPEDKNKDLKQGAFRARGHETGEREQLAQREDAAPPRVVERVLTADELARLLADLAAMGVVPGVSRSDSTSSSETKKESSAPRTYRLVFEVAPDTGR